MSTPAAPVAASLKKTPLNATHRALKAKMVDFGGWDMPVEYPCPRLRGLIAEHLAVRNRRGPLRRLAHGRNPVSRARRARCRAAHHHERRIAPQRRPGPILRAAHARREPSSTTSSSIASAPTTICSSSTPAPKTKTWRGFARTRAAFPPSTSPTTRAYYSQLALQGPKALATLAEAHQSRSRARSRITGSPWERSPAFPT